MGYSAHLPAMYFQERENLRTLLEGTILSKLHGHVLSKNWYLCSLCWDDCEQKNLHPPTLGGGDHHHQDDQNIPGEMTRVPAD